MSEERPEVATKSVQVTGPGMEILLVLPNGEPYARWNHEGDERWVNDLQQGITIDDVLSELGDHVEELLHGR